ncbi:MAG: UMP kinase [Candidatus Hermodarchaeota archaeon]|jgi:uridylate kinase|nr:UMP kinase [Candidatus Hermodarchaeota archaeon]
MKIVMKIGGSLLFDADQQYKLDRYKEYAQLIQQLKKEGHEIILIVGGGSLAKSLVEKGKLLGGERDALDYLGIAATWLCAQLMITALGKLAYPIPVMTEEQLLTLQQDGRLLVLGGLEPRQSTNAVAARVAELTQSEVLLNITDVEGVFDHDPKQSNKAKLLALLTVSQLQNIIDSLDSEPGTYPLFDKRALEIIQRSGIEVWFVSGQDTDKILHAIKTQKPGTRVVPS